MVRVSGRVVFLVLIGSERAPRRQSRVSDQVRNNLFATNAGIHFLENKKYTFEELAITVM